MGFKALFVHPTYLTHLQQYKIYSKQHKISISTYTSSQASFTPRVKENLHLVSSFIYTSSQEQLTPRVGCHGYLMQGSIYTR